jgi:DNA-binding transcriptional regulator YiaG
MWRPRDFDFDGTTVLVTLTDEVQVIQILADVEPASRTAVFRGLHILGGGRNTPGPRALRELIDWAKVHNLMSTNSELKARFARLGPVRDVSRPSLSSDDSVVVVLHRTGELEKGILVARRLVAAGLTLKQAHDAINKLAALGWAVCAIAKTTDPRALANDLAALNVELRRKLPAPSTVADIAEMRARRGLSQREYADLLGLDIRTLQNWEQGRNRPDPAAVALMRIFDRAPDTVGEALTEPVV